MSLALAGAACLLVIVVFCYVCLRRGRHGGLAGGDSRELPPHGVAERGAGRTFTVEEVEQHSSADDLWLIINGGVYDFTDVCFLEIESSSSFSPLAKCILRVEWSADLSTRSRLFVVLQCGRGLLACSILHYILEVKRFCVMLEGTQRKAFLLATTHKGCGIWFVIFATALSDVLCVVWYSAVCLWDC